MTAPATIIWELSGSTNITIAISGPIKGANEKYVPARAVPKCRKARMNKTRLKPTLGNR